MERIKQKSKIDHKKILELCGNVFVFCFIFLFCASNIFAKPICDLDEIWNYNFARNIANGLIPYNDFNMIQTPLLPFICAFFLKVIGNKLITMRVLAVIIQTLIFYLGYELIKKYGKDNKLSILVICGIMLLSKDVIAIDYNYATLLVTLIILIIELKHLNNEDYFKFEFKYDFLLGILVGLTVLLKQTTGLVLAVAFIGYKLFEVRNKSDFVKYLKKALIRLVGVIIPVIIFIIYLLITKSFESFMSYCILGIRDFNNVIKYKGLLEIKYIKELSILVPIILGCLFVFQFAKKDKIFNILFAYSLASFAVAFPISDEIHFLIGAYISLISGSFFVIRFLNESIEGEKTKKIKFILVSFITAFVVLYVGYKSCIKIINEYIVVPKEKELAFFEGIPENTGLKERILEIDEFIVQQENQGNKVYVLDAEAAIYFIPLNKYNKDYDMFLKGNLGKNGESGIIERINSEKNAIYLIKKEGYNWQTPLNVREFIMNKIEDSNKETKSIFWVYRNI